MFIDNLSIQASLSLRAYISSLQASNTLDEPPIYICDLSGVTSRMSYEIIPWPGRTQSCLMVLCSTLEEWKSRNVS